MYAMSTAFWLVILSVFGFINNLHKRIRSWVACVWTFSVQCADWILLFVVCFDFLHHRYLNVFVSLYNWKYEFITIWCRCACFTGTPLHVAVKKHSKRVNCSQTVAFLLSQGADVLAQVCTILLFCHYFCGLRSVCYILCAYTAKFVVTKCMM